jgi:hypothetical protein
MDIAILLKTSPAVPMVLRPDHAGRVKALCKGKLCVCETENELSQRGVVLGAHT